MSTKVYLGGKAIALTPAMAIGKGGEADVYALADGRALKLFKSAKHPDVRDSAAERDAAKRRLDEHQTKLRNFPRALPDRVVAPEELATARGGRRIVGYAMQRIDDARLLLRYAEPRFRRQHTTGAQALNVLRDLHTTVAGIHAAGVVLGDFNDLNVLVARGRAFVIDADSFQFGSHLCAVFTERFVDPLLCDANANAPLLVAPHSATSDWYAFAIMAMRTLLCVGPYGGVHKPANAADRVAPGRRPLERVTVFDPAVLYPKPALHYRVLPDELLDFLEDTFVRDARAPFPATLLDRLRWTRCTACNLEHARTVCPTCSAGARQQATPVLRVRGAVTSKELPMTPALAAYWQDGMERDGRGPARAGERTVWLSGSDLVRDGRFASERIGRVLPNTTRFWVGEQFGLGFYQAGRFQVGFAFDSARGGLNDQVVLPPITGTLVDAHCVLSDARAWLMTFEQRGPKLIGRCTVVAHNGAIVASSELEVTGDAWIASARTACAAGDALFVATDEGIVRVEATAGAVHVTRTFADTEPFVTASCRLRIDPAQPGIAAVFPERAALLTL